MKSSLLLLVFMLAFAGGARAQQYPLQVEPVFRNYGQDVGLPTSTVYGILQDSKGYIWVATDQGVCRFNGYEFEQLPDTLYCNFNSVFGKSMTEDESGRLWFVDIRWRVFYVEHDRIIPWKYNAQLKAFHKDGKILNGILVKGRGEEIWFGTTHSGIIHADQNGQINILPGLETADRVFFERKSGGLDSRYQGHSRDHFLQKLSQILNIQGENIQVPLFPFTRDSLARYTFTTSSVSRLAESIWLLNSFGSYFYIKNNRLLWRRKAPVLPLIWAMQDASGRIFTGHQLGGGLTMYLSLDDFRDNRPALSALPGMTVTCIFQDREGGYWIATLERGIFYCASFESGRLAGLPGLEDAPVADIAWDSQSTVFVAFQNGKVSAIDRDKLIASDISPPKVRFINAIVFNQATRTLGLAGYNNAFYKNGAWQRLEFLETGDGQKGPWNSRALTPSQHPDVWLGVGPSGLVQANIKTKKVERSTYDFITGKGGRRYVSAREDQSGRIWAYSIDGFVEWTGDRIDSVFKTNPIFLQNTQEIELLPDTSLVLCPYDSADITIDLLSLYFRGNGKTPYAYRLVHGSGDTSWQLRAGRRISFLNLQPGKYRLEVKTQGEANIWSPISMLDIVIYPPWWATWWARSLFAIGLGWGVFGLYRYRTGQIVHESRLKEEMLRLERSALQAQMSPHFIFNCLNSIQNFILKNDSDAAVLYLARFAKLVRSSLNASVEGGVSLDEEINMLNHYLTLEQLRFKQAFEYHISVDPMLDQAHTMLPPLIVQPFVENAVLHGLKDLQKDGLILIKFYPDNGMLCVEVRDNGLGLGQEKSKTGDVPLGGSITRRRLELLNEQSTKDEISIAYSTPEVGTGTIVLIRLPLLTIGGHDFQHESSRILSHLRLIDD